MFKLNLDIQLSRSFVSNGGRHCFRIKYQNIYLVYDMMLFKFVKKKMGTEIRPYRKLYRYFMV